MPRRIHLLVFVLLLLSINYGFAAHVKGTVKDVKGQALPYASVYVKNSTLGIATDLKGRFFFELEKEKYTLVFSYLGYQTIEREVNLINNESIELNIILKENATELAVVEVVANTKNLAREIMSKVRAKRKFYLNQLRLYQCDTYIKTSLDRKLIKPSKSDTLVVADKKMDEEEKKTIEKNRNAFFDKDNLDLVEVVSKTYFKAPNTFKEKIIAQKDYSERFKSNKVFEYYADRFGQVAPQQYMSRNSYMVYASVSEPDFNFYKNTIDFPAVCAKPLLSPLATNAALNYTYNFEGSFIEDGKKVYKIAVKARFPSDPLFNGILFIQDSSYSIKSVDLSINKEAMFYCKEFKILQNYDLHQEKYSLPVRREIVYTIKDGRNHYLGNTSVRHKNYIINPNLPKKFFGNEVITYEEDAFDKDSLFWLNSRPIALKKAEEEFIFKADSVQAYYASDEFFHKQDSIFNRLSAVNILFNGFGHTNTARGFSINFLPLIEQINPFGIGGYRHSLGGLVTKEFVNNNILAVNGKIGYGFVNKDVKGNLGVGFTYLPKKFLRTYIRIGDTYEQINHYESIEGFFSRGNYVRSKTFSIQQRMEIVNGLFAAITFKYSNQIPISNLKLTKWSENLFGELNAPKEFDPYKKAEFKLLLQFRPFQKYLIKHRKKILLGSKFPQFFLEYRKGINGLFDSEVNYDYIELGLGDYVKLGRWGFSNWIVKAGTFINKNNLRFLEHKFFRGSDYLFFSNPIQSFQLLGPTINTRNEYFHANFIHHFEGTILNKVPLIRKLRLGLAGGVGTLLIRDIDFAHFEMFAGIERKIKIKRELLRLGLYATTSDNTLEHPSIRLKIGIDFFNTFSKKWEY